MTDRSNSAVQHDPDCYCDECMVPEERELETCHFCGKELEDFSDLGCERCDRRHPGFGVL